MPAIDNILRLVHGQGANELRIGTDRAPAMFAAGVPKSLTLRPTSESDLRYLLGPLLSKERELLLRRDGQLEFSYFLAGIGNFHVTFSRRGVESKEGPLLFDGVFVYGRPNSPAPTPPQVDLRWTSSEAPTGVIEPSSGPPATLDAGAAQRRALVDTVPPQKEAHSSLEGATTQEISQALASLLAAVAERKASDLHLLSGEAPFVRVDGRLRPLSEAPTESVEAVLGGLLGPSERRQLLSGNSVDLAVHIPGAGRFRLNIFRSSSGLALVARALPANVPSLSSLNLPLPLDDLLDLPNGLILITGPTGSGKSTTLAALAQEILRRRSALLLALEDPIEYTFAPTGKGSLVRQRQVGRDVASFAAGLRDALREDPDILLVGEMRDPESIALALTAAETGHLVLTSLRSRSAASAIERIVDAYPSERQRQIRVQLADSLRVVLAQRLLPRAKGGGRVPALEVLRVTYDVANHIREGKTEQLPSDIQTGRREGMMTLERSLADLVRDGHITGEQARAAANEPSMLAEYLRGG
ncbi:MAG: PilT/PilU family type 4a pilus ATPase [Myxococcales bacterium]|nr:PilT/PilU family type 4a pilus ATPase [Polyangiaceae bacterium]MDW8249866.1 PilT/PilU family type 4a pilus ATPase [Myxococcales bacterium]